MNSPRENKRWPLALTAAATVLAAVVLVARFSPKETSAETPEIPEQTTRTTQPATPSENHELIAFVKSLFTPTEPDTFQSRIDTLLTATEDTVEVWEEYCETGEIPDNQLSGCVDSGFTFFDLGDPEVTDGDTPPWVGVDYFPNNDYSQLFWISVYHPDGKRFFLEATADPESFCEDDEEGLKPYVVRIHSSNLSGDKIEVICAENFKALREALGVTPVLDRAREMCDQVPPPVKEY